ncbi:TPA: transposase [Candidatus Poribacteria bacterium]|nr:transposase [Candidatus Poribacteria bacterium]
MEGLDPGMVIADKADDANDFIQMIQDMEAMVVIPARSNRTNNQEYNHHWYKDRNLMERFFNRIKQFRRIARRLITTSCLCSTWCVPLSAWREC